MRYRKAISILPVATLLIALAACSNSATPERPSPPSAGNWELTVRGGTTNIDESFFPSLQGALAPQAARWSQLQTEFFDFTGQQLSPQATVGVGINFYVSLTNSGKPSATPVPLAFFGPSRAYPDTAELAAGFDWSVYYPFIPQGAGEYGVSATIGGSRLSKKVAIDPSKLLSPVLNLRASRSGSLLAARWDAVENAQSYLALIYDFEHETVVEGYVTKELEIIVESFPFVSAGKHDVSVFALSWDATSPAEKPYPQPLPATFDISVAAWPFYNETPAITVWRDEVIVSGSNLAPTPTTVNIRNDKAGVLLYRASIENSDRVTIKQGASGAVHYGDSRDIELEPQCNGEDVQEMATLVIESNDPENPSVSLDLKVECLDDLVATQLFGISVEGFPESLEAISKVYPEVSVGLDLVNGSKREAMAAA